MLKRAEAPIPTGFQIEDMDEWIGAGIARYVVDALRTCTKRALPHARHKLSGSASGERHRQEGRVGILDVVGCRHLPLRRGASCAVGRGVHPYGGGAALVPGWPSPRVRVGVVRAAREPRSGIKLARRLTNPDVSLKYDEKEGNIEQSQRRRYEQFAVRNDARKADPHN